MAKYHHDRISWCNCLVGSDVLALLAISKIGLVKKRITGLGKNSGQHEISSAMGWRNKMFQRKE